MISFRGFFLLVAALPAVFVAGQEYNNSWSAADSSNGLWTSMATSSDGKNVIAVTNDGYMYQSSNNGVSWTQTNTVPAGSYSWEAVASDSSGDHLAVVSGNNGASGSMYLSSNAGESWTLSSAAQNEAWTDVAYSYTGQYLLATSSGTTGGAGGTVYVSNNYGDTWNPSLTSIETSYTGVDISANGQNIVVVSSNGKLKHCKYFVSFFNTCDV